MKTDEAIKSLENIVEYWTYRPTEREAAQMAIAALREKQERRRGCCHCKSVAPLQQGIGCAPYASSAHIAKDSVMWCGNEAIRINFCPMCGKGLGEANG